MYANSPLRTWTMCAFTLLAGPALLAQKPTQPPAQPAPADPEQVIRTSVELITTDVIVRDNRGQFVADLKKDEF